MELVQLTCHEYSIKPLISLLHIHSQKPVWFHGIHVCLLLWYTIHPLAVTDGIQGRYGCCTVWGDVVRMPC